MSGLSCPAWLHLARLPVVDDLGIGNSFCWAMSMAIKARMPSVWAESFNVDDLPLSVIAHGINFPVIHT